MAGKDNLRAPSPEEARERGRKGGKASAEARKKRKAFKDAILAVLAEPLTDKAGNPHPSGMNVQEAMIRGVIKRAINGDPRAMEVIRDTVGEKPVQQVEVATPKAELAGDIADALAQREKDLMAK